MNIETLKSGFESYILRTTGISSEEYLEQYSDVSVWLNCDEFREYLEDEYNVDYRIFSGDITNILNMEFKNGELVLDEELEIIEQEKETLEQEQGQNELELEEEMLTSQDSSELENIKEEIVEIPAQDIVQDITEPSIDETLEEQIDKDLGVNADEVVDGEVIGEEIADENIDDATANKDALEETTQEEPIQENTSKETTQENTTQTEDKSININDKDKLSQLKINKENEDEIIDLINNLLEDEEFKKYNDLNQDGKIDFEELEAFYNTAKDYDKDEEELSLLDLESAAQKIKDGTFKLDENDEDLTINDKNNINEDEKIDEEIEEEVEEIEEEIDEEIEEEVEEETEEEVKEVEETPQSSSTGGSTGGSYSPSSSSSKTPSTKKDTEKTSQFAGLSVDELQAKQQEEQTTLDGAKTNYLNALNGSHAELEATKTAQNDAQKAYTNALEEKEKGLGVEMDRIYTENFAAAEQKNAATEELSMTEADITAQDEIINNCTTRISQLEGLKSSLQSQINSAKEGDSEAVTSAQSKIAEIDSQIAAEEAKKKAAEEKKGQLETRKGELTTLIGEIDAKIAQLDADYQKIKDRVNELTQEPEIRAIFDAFSAAVSNHEAKRAELTASEKSKIDTAQANLSAIRKEMPIAQEKEDKAKYSNVAASYDKEFGETLAQNAKNMWSGKEAQGLCLGGVSKSFGRSFIGSDGKGVGVPFASAYMAYYAFTNDPEGYKEATGGEMNEAQLRSARELSQKYKEIEVTEDELDTLPAGAVVIWEGSQQNKHGHISISLGDGREASDAVYKQTHKSYHHNADFHVFIPTV